MRLNTAIALGALLSSCGESEVDSDTKEQISSTASDPVIALRSGIHTFRNDILKDVLAECEDLTIADIRAVPELNEDGIYWLKVGFDADPSLQECMRGVLSGDFKMMNSDTDLSVVCRAYEPRDEEVYIDFACAEDGIELPEESALPAKSTEVVMRGGNHLGSVLSQATMQLRAERLEGVIDACPSIELEDLSHFTLYQSRINAEPIYRTLSYTEIPARYATVVLKPSETEEAQECIEEYLSREIKFTADPNTLCRAFSPRDAFSRDDREGPAWFGVECVDPEKLFP